MKKDDLLAVVTLNKEAVGGDIPIFFASTQEEQAAVAATLSQVLKAMVHDIGNGVYIIVRH
ncbi:MAG: hypothetical protein CVV03_12285 [Firmicutes bacterium HGW-Firmicutes-8]|nr:MAG: hypothetical protein CVV03_12285 [Firmicutes bacterium HGW-Firmicutes-8]